MTLIHILVGPLLLIIIGCAPAVRSQPATATPSHPATSQPSTHNAPAIADPNHEAPARDLSY